MVTVTNKLSEEHLIQWRRCCAKRDAVSYNPEAFDAETTMWTFNDYYSLANKLAEIYDIDLSEEWVISPYTGIIYYED